MPSPNSWFETETDWRIGRQHRQWNGNEGIPPLQTFYFKIPSNDKLLGYWSTVADRLNKMRHCQSLTGAPLQLALFDAPIDPGLLIAAKAGGVDLSSVLSSIFAPLPSYRYTSLYPVALDFVNAVRAYGAGLQSALEKSDADALTLLQQTLQQQLLSDGSQIFDWQVQQAQSQIDNLNQALALFQSRQSFYGGQSFTNAWEDIGIEIDTAVVLLYAYAAIAEGIASVAHILPSFVFGAAGFGSSPTANAGEGQPTSATRRHRPRMQAKPPLLRSIAPQNSPTRSATSSIEAMRGASRRPKRTSRSRKPTRSLPAPTWPADCAKDTRRCIRNKSITCSSRSIF